MTSNSQPAWSSWLLVLILAPAASLALGELFGTPPSWEALQTILLAQAFLIAGGSLVLLLVHAADGAPEQNPVSFVKELQANRSPLCREVSANRAAWEREIQLRLQRMHEEAAALSGLEITGRPAETLKLEVPPAGLPETAIKRRAPGTSGRRAA